MFEAMRKRYDETDEEFAKRMAILDRSESAGVEIKAFLDKMVYEKDYEYSNVYGALAYAFAEHMAETCCQMDAQIFAAMLDERLDEMQFPCKDQY